MICNNDATLFKNYKKKFDTMSFLYFKHGQLPKAEKKTKKTLELNKDNQSKYLTSRYASQL